MSTDTLLDNTTPFTVNGKNTMQHAYNSADMDAFPCEKFTLGKEQRTKEKIFFHCNMVVFGDEYTSTFVKDVLPTQLGPDNIEALNSEARSIYVFYTTPEDLPTIKESPAFAELAQIMDIRIHIIDYEHISSANKYNFMIQSHKHSIRKAHEEGARALFLAPDLIFPKCAFRNLYRRTAEGHKAIMIGTMRVTKEEFLPKMHELFFADNDIAAPIAARALVDLVIDNLHPDTRNSIIGSSRSTGWPSQLLWEIPGEGILARNFHLQPIMVYPVELNEFNGTVDDDCVRKICKNIEDVYITHDSDEIAAFDLSKKDIRTIEQDKPFNIEYAAAWADDHADEFHRQFVEHEIRFHNGKSGPLWTKLSENAAEVVDAIKNHSPSEEEHFFPKVLLDYDLRFPPLKIDSPCINNNIEQKEPDTRITPPHLEETKTDIPGPEETRFCLSPWNSPHVTPCGDVYSCRIRQEVMSRTDENTSLRKAMHSASFTELRKQLITGNIKDPACRNCPIAPVRPLRDLKRSIADMIRASIK